MLSKQIIAIGQIAFALVSILTLGGILVKWTIVKPLKSFIAEQTYPIQPHANGGDSLPDVIKTVKRIENKLDQHIDVDHGR